MAGKKKGEGKATIPIIQADGEVIRCQRCGYQKTRYKRDFPYCYECYNELVRRGEMIDV